MATKTTQRADRNTKPTQTWKAPSANFGDTYDRLRSILKPFDRGLAPSYIPAAASRL